MRIEVYKYAMVVAAVAAGDEWGGVPLSHYNISRLTRGLSFGLNPVKRQTANKGHPKKGSSSSHSLLSWSSSSPPPPPTTVVCTQRALETHKGVLKYR